MIRFLKRFLNHEIIKDEKGQTLAEYAVLISLVAFTVLGVLTVVGRKSNHVFQAVGRPMTTQLATNTASVSSAPGTTLNLKDVPSDHLLLVKKWVPENWSTPWSSNPKSKAAESEQQQSQPQ